MGKHTDVVTYPSDESPFGGELPVPGFIHRARRPGARGDVVTLVVEGVEVVDGEVHATVSTWDGPLCPVPSPAVPADTTPDGPVAVDPGPSRQASLFTAPVATSPADGARRSHPAGRTATLPRRAESPSGA